MLVKPGNDEPQSVRDAFRESGFALRGDLDWLLSALSLQRSIVEASYGSAYRNHRYAAALLQWSRVYGSGLELLRMTARGNYAACPALVRASLDWLAAEQAVVGEEFSEFEAWLGEAYRADAALSATDVGMGQYMAGQQVAMSEDLSTVYRAAAELARPHFGATAVLIAAESNRQKLALHWGDESFHYGFGQLLLGWQVLIQERQLRFAIGRGLFAVGREEREAYQRLSREADTLLGAQGRCRAEWVEKDGRQRLLIHNFRRQPSGAPQRILL